MSDLTRRERAPDKTFATNGLCATLAVGLPNNTTRLSTTASEVPPAAVTRLVVVRCFVSNRSGETEDIAARVRDDWGEDALSLDLKIDHDKTALAGLNQLDVARATSAALVEAPMGVLHDGDRTLPIVLRLAMDERARLSDLSSL